MSEQEHGYGGDASAPVAAAAQAPPAYDATHSINQRIFNTSLDLILVVDRRGTFLRVSPSSQAILGYSSQELIGRSAKEILYPDDLDATRQEMRLARRGLIKGCQRHRRVELALVQRDDVLGHRYQFRFGLWIHCT